MNLEVEDTLNFYNNVNEKTVFILTKHEIVNPPEDCQTSVVNNCDCLASLKLQYSLDSELVFTMIISQSRNIDGFELTLFIDDCSKFYQKDYNLNDDPKEYYDLNCGSNLFKSISMGESFYFDSFIDNHNLLWTRSKY